MRRPTPPPTLRGLLNPAFGPLVRGSVIGGDAEAPGLFMLDTGASMSAIDREVARELALPTDRAAEWRAITSTGGSEQSPLRRGHVRLGTDRRHFPLELIEVPKLRYRIEGFPVVALLGWDFLAACRLTVDGPNGTFTLELPH